MDTFSWRAEIGIFCVFNRCVKFSYGPCCWQFGDIKATLAALQQDGRIAFHNPMLHYITLYYITFYIVLHWCICPCCSQFGDIKATLAALQQDGRIAVYNPMLHYITWYYIIFYIVLHWWIGPCCSQFGDIKATLAALHQEQQQKWDYLTHTSVHFITLHWITLHYIVLLNVTSIQGHVQHNSCQYDTSSLSIESIQNNGKTKSVRWQKGYYDLLFIAILNNTRTQ